MPRRKGYSQGGDAMHDVPSLQDLELGAGDGVMKRVAGGKGAYDTASDLKSGKSDFGGRLIKRHEAPLATSASSEAFASGGAVGSAPKRPKRQSGPPGQTFVGDGMGIGTKHHAATYLRNHPSRKFKY